MKDQTLEEMIDNKELPDYVRGLALFLIQKKDDELNKAEKEQA